MSTKSPYICHITFCHIEADLIRVLPKTFTEIDDSQFNLVKKCVDLAGVNKPKKQYQFNLKKILFVIWPASCEKGTFGHMQKV